MKGIEKIIKIGDKEVKMRASAASPRIYRNVFGGSDMFAEVEKFKIARETGGNYSFEVVENMAYLFAYQADENIPDIETWLDGFGITELYEAMPQILELWEQNTETKSKEKK